MSRLHPILRPVLTVLHRLSYLLLWLLLGIALLLVFERLGSERYGPGDTPHGQFQILVLQDDDTPRLQALRDYRPGTRLARQAGLSGRQGDHFFRLSQVEPDIWQLYADRETAISTQRYRIEGEQVTPLEFRWRNVGHGFIALFAALPLLWLCHRGFLALWRRHAGKTAAGEGA